MPLSRIFSATRLKLDFRIANEETVKTLKALVLLFYLFSPPLLLFMLVSTDILITKVSIYAGFSQEINPMKQALNTGNANSLLFWMYVGNIATTLLLFFTVVYAAISKSARNSVIILLILLAMWVMTLSEAWIVYNNIEEMRPGLATMVAKLNQHP